MTASIANRSLDPARVSFGHVQPRAGDTLRRHHAGPDGRRRTERRLAVQYAATRMLAESATLRESRPPHPAKPSARGSVLVGAIWTVVGRGRAPVRRAVARAVGVRQGVRAMSRRIAAREGRGAAGSGVGRRSPCGSPTW